MRGKACVGRDSQTAEGGEVLEHHRDRGLAGFRGLVLAQEPDPEPELSAYEELEPGLLNISDSEAFYDARSEASGSKASKAGRNSVPGGRDRCAARCPWAPRSARGSPGGSWRPPSGWRRC